MNSHLQKREVRRSRLRFLRWLVTDRSHSTYTRETMSTDKKSSPQISPMLAVSDAAAATEFYKKAFGAEVLWTIEGGGVAGLSIDGAEFFLADEAPEYGTRGPDRVGATTVRIELFVDDPRAVHARAIAAGAREASPVKEHEHTTFGPRPIRRMLQGSVVDPFGHKWLIGKFLE